MSLYMDLKGTTQSSFQIQKGGPRFRNASGVLEARNAADSAYADFVALILRAAGDSLVLNNDAAGSGADWKMTFARPTSGMTADVVYTMPAAPINGYYLTTDGSGNLSWATVSTPSVQERITVDSTPLVFGDSSPVAMFTLPTGAVVHWVDVVVDTAFDGTPTLNIGIAGDTDKYADENDIDLTSGAKDRWRSHPNELPPGSPEAIIATYVDGGATVGAARLLVAYSIPA